MDITRAFFDILWQDQESRNLLLVLTEESDDVYALEDLLKDTLDVDGVWDDMHTRIKPYETAMQYSLSLFIGQVVGAIRYDELASLIWAKR